MRFLLKVLSTLVGFVFTLGVPVKGQAQESRATGTATTVMARQNPSMNSGWYDSERARFLTLLAATKDDKPGKNKDTKAKTKRKTRPTRETKSPHKKKVK